MKLFLIALSAVVIVTAIFVGANRRDQLQDMLTAYIGGRPGPVADAQLMRMGRISGPGSGHSVDSDGTQRQMAQADATATTDMADLSSGQSSALPGDENAAAAQQPAPASEDGATPVAQANPSSPATATPSPAETEQPAVDESALRYFASRGDKARLQAEISRLRALYPNWTPPADPLAVPQNQDKKLEAMWQLYSEARYAELRKAIIDRQGTEPGWQPPPDLLDRLNVAEARTRLINASDLKQYDAVVQLAAETPSLLTCSEVDVLWRVAEAFDHTDRVPRARDAYLYILKNCDNAAERLATIQKASALLPYATMQDLLAQEKPVATGGREFDSIRDDLSRRFVAEANDEPNLAISPDYLIRVQQIAVNQGLASDALLLGWYSLRRQNMAEAEKWFRAARAKEDSASASQGLALTLIARKAPQEAEEVMYQWRESSKDATATYLAASANVLALDPPPTLQVEVLQRIAAEVLKQRDPASAQQLGWYARAFSQPETAAQWFETALRWKPDDEPSAYGLAITRQQLNDKTGVAEIQRLWTGRSVRIANLGETDRVTEQGRVPLPSPGTDRNQTQAIDDKPLIIRREPPAQSVVTRAPAPQMVSARPAAQPAAVRGARPRGVAGCSTTIDPATLRPAEALPRGWCLMELNRPMEAAAAFEIGLRSDQQKAREDAAYGQSLAYLRLGLSSDAAVAAAKAPQNRQRALELQTAILTNRATNAFDTKRYREAILYLDQLGQIQPERMDLMVLRGYAYLNMKRYSDAIRIFEAAAATGNHEAITALSNAREAQRSPGN